MEFGELVREWRSVPYAAFARLAFHVRNAAVREAALAAYMGNHDGYEARKTRWGRVLAGAATVPAPSAVDVLALLAEMDATLAAETAGHEPKPVRVSDPGAWVVQRPLGWRSPTLQPRQLPFWLRHHWVLPADCDGITIDVSACDGSLGERLTALLAEGSVSVFVGGFDDGVQTRFATQAPKYGQPSLSDTAVRTESGCRAFHDARDGGAHLVVLPELTVCADTRVGMVDWLATEPHPFVLVCPGSFHEGEGPWNVARVYDGHGDLVHTHHKMAPMRIEHPDNGVDEDIRGVPRLPLLATPIGLVAVGVCLDFAEGDDPVFQTLWNHVGPGLVLVPSMSNESTRNAHEARAKGLARLHGTVSAVAIQRVEGDKGTTGGIVAWNGGTRRVEPPSGRVRGEIRTAMICKPLLTDGAAE